MSFQKINPEELKILAIKADPSSGRWIASFNKKQANRLDEVVHLLHERIFTEIDCLTCANCCKCISPAIYDRDVDRLSKSQRMKPSEFIQTYLIPDNDNDYVFRQTPCPFLDNDNYCRVYADRPKACREYPHTDRKRFYQLLKLTQTNASICPAAYHVMEELKKYI